MGMLFLLIAFVVLMPSSSTQLTTANLQEIKLLGPIITADAVLKEIEEAQKDTKIKGVLFNVNSPGGAVPPSIEIAYAIKELKKHKPVVVYASGIMASGSYYASIYANTIIANPGSIVGSIGVIMESANIEELMNTIHLCKHYHRKSGVYRRVNWCDHGKCQYRRTHEYYRSKDSDRQTR
jgi:protease-4